MFEKINKKYKYFAKKEPLKIVDKCVKWENLKKFGSNKFISSMYVWLFVVPIAKKFLSKLNEILKVDLQVPFSWDMFFYAAVCFVIGNIIYFVFSPEFIKLYRDYSQYLASERDINYLRGILNRDFENEIVKPRIIHLESNQFKNNVSGSFKIDVSSSDFYDAYDTSNKLNGVTRLACAIAYVSGLFLFSLVILQNFIWMISH